MPDEKLTIGLGLPGEGIVEELFDLVGKIRESQSPFVQQYWDLAWIELHMNLRRKWAKLAGSEWTSLPELEAHAKGPTP